MKRVLGVASITILVTLTAQAGLVTDEGIGINRASKSKSIAAQGVDSIPKPATSKPTKQSAPPPHSDKEKENTPTAATARTVEFPKKKHSKANTSGSFSKHNRGIFVALAKGNGSVESIAIGLEFFSTAIWFESRNAILTPYLELLAAYWDSDPNKGHTGIQDLHEGGVTGYVRYIRNRREGGFFRPYADMGIGVHYVSEDRIEGKELGKQWLAGSNFGIGAMLGTSERFDIGLRIRHLSNAGTEDLNWGMNHIMLRTGIRF